MSERGVIELIRDIRSGVVSPKSLSTEDRRRAVEHLMLEGGTTAEIASALKVCERTISRDKTSIRKENAVRVDPAMAGEVVGQMLARADSSIGSLTRIARSRETPPAVRVEAEKAAWGVKISLVDRLQRLGYLPTAPTQAHVLADHRHRVEIADAGELADEVTRLEVIARSSGASDETLAQIAEAKGDVDRLVVTAQIRKLEDTVDSEAKP